MHVQCPTCGALLSAPDGQAGSIYSCPKCGNPMQLPEVSGGMARMISPDAAAEAAGIPSPIPAPPPPPGAPPPTGAPRKTRFGFDEDVGARPPAATGATPAVAPDAPPAAGPGADAGAAGAAAGAAAGTAVPGTFARRPVTGPAPAKQPERPCPHCGKTILVAALQCHHCQTWLSGPEAGRKDGSGQPLPDVKAMLGGAAPEPTGDGKKALIFGIIGFFCCGFIFGSLAIYYGAKALNNPADRPMGIVGIVLGGVDILGNLIVSIVLAAARAGGQASVPPGMPLSP